MPLRRSEVPATSGCSCWSLMFSSLTVDELTARSELLAWRLAMLTRRQQLFCLVLSAGGLGWTAADCAQVPIRPLKIRERPCQLQYAQAIQTIGLARWSAPDYARPSLERLLNAAARAKELVDVDFQQWVLPLCSTETLSRLKTSVDLIETNRWLPVDPEDRRDAEVTAANSELLKALGAGLK